MTLTKIRANLNINMEISGGKFELQNIYSHIKTISTTLGPSYSEPINVTVTLKLPISTEQYRCRQTSGVLVKW